MNTSMWGPSLWDHLHTISANSNQVITTEMRQTYITYFESLSTVLPCRYCRHSFVVFLYFFPLRKFCSTRLEFSYWVYVMHNLVNEKLGKTTSIRFKDVVWKYEQRRVRCDRYIEPTQEDCDRVQLECQETLQRCESRYRRYLNACGGNYELLADLCQKKKA